MQNNSYTHQYVVEPFDLDLSARLSPLLLGKHILNIAEKHASLCGFGMNNIRGRNLTWVLSRLSFEFINMPKMFETFFIKTYIEQPMKMFSTRNFIIMNEAKQPIVYAKTIWAMIDFETREPVNILEFDGGLMNKFVCDGNDCKIDKFTNFRMKNAQVIDEISPKYSDFDINYHVNSIKYIEFMMNSFNAEFFLNHNLKKLDISYSAETVIGQKLSILHEKENLTNYFEIKNKETEKVSCRARLIFEEK